MRFLRYLPDLVVLASLALVPLAVYWVFPNQGVSDKSPGFYGLPLLFGWLVAARPVAWLVTSVWAWLILLIAIVWTVITLRQLSPADLPLGLLLGVLGLAGGLAYGQHHKRTA